MNIRLTRTLDTDLYEVKIPKKKKQQYLQTSFGVVHDYMYLEGTSYLKNIDGSISDVSSKVRLQVPIRSFAQVMLPILMKSKHATPETLAESGTTYSYSNQVVRYYDEERGEGMVAFMLKGETKFNYITSRVFDDFIEPNLK